MIKGISFEMWLILSGALAVALLVCANASSLGERLHVLAKPDDERRLHDGTIPQVGGIAIITSLVLWCIAVLLNGLLPDAAILHTILLCAAGVGLIGFADDQVHTLPLPRALSLVVFLAIAFLLDPGLVASSLNWGSFAPTPISPWAYKLLMAVAAVGLVNAVNMADGQDGVVGSMFVVWAGCLMLVTDGTAAMIALVILATSLVFLAFNLRGKLFLGDTGSYGVSFAIGLLVAFAHAKGQLPLETVIVWFFIPVADCLRLIISRLIRGRSPFEGDRDHFHHRLENKLGKHIGLVTYAGVVGATSVTSAIAPRFSLVCLTVLAAIYFSFAGLTAGETNKARGDGEGDEEGDEEADRHVANVLSFGERGADHQQSDGR